MVEDLVKDLLEAGVHFGHQTQRWNPKMKRYIFGERAGIYIIDLEKTAEALKAAQEYIKDITSKGGTVLFVGTKKQAKIIIEEEAQKCEQYFVTNRWLGGLLTNFQTVKKSIARMDVIEKMQADGMWDNLKKKETARLNKEQTKLNRDLGGIREMKTAPDVIFLIDPKKEEIAIKEAQKLEIPIVAIVDTNCDPESVLYPIPGNDDALKSIRFITEMISKSITEGRHEYKESSAKQKEKSDQPKNTDDKVKEATKDVEKPVQSEAAKQAKGEPSQVETPEEPKAEEQPSA